MPNSGLDRLVDDILIQILRALPVQAVLSLRKTSRRYYLLSKFRCVWYARFCGEVLARNLPLPGLPLPLSLLSATELERRTLRALHLDRAWPRLSAKTLISRHQHEPGVGVDQVVFIPGGTELLTVQGDKVVHWFIVSYPGLASGLKCIGEWTPLDGVPCRIIKDGDETGVFAVGPREPLGSHRFSKVVSTSLNAPFSILCDYARVPGFVVGIWRHLLLLDTTNDPGEGGLELLDWRVQTTGTAFLSCLPDMFGRFLDFVVFFDHLVIVWEHCVSVYPVPRIPTDGQVVVEHERVYILQDAVTRPVGFTTCVTRRVAPSRFGADVGLVQDPGWGTDSDGQCVSSMLGMLPTLTITARTRRRADSMSMMMLVPLLDDHRLFPYRLTCLSPYWTTAWELKIEGEKEDTEPRPYTTLCIGSSGRGLFVVGRELRLVSPGLLILPPYEMQLGPVFETGKAIYLVDRPRKWGSDRRSHLAGIADAEEEEEASGDKVDFDEGMGRFVVACEGGGFEVVELS